MLHEFIDPQLNWMCSSYQSDLCILTCITKHIFQGNFPLFLEVVLLLKQNTNTNTDASTNTQSQNVFFQGDFPLFEEVVLLLKQNTNTDSITNTNTDVITNTDVQVNYRALLHLLEV